MEMGVFSHQVLRKGDRRRPMAWDVAKSEYFLKWDAIKGEQIPKETLEFFIHVKEKLNQPFHDDEDKELFIQNVFSQTRGEEVLLIKNSLASQIVEQLIPDVGDEVLLEFATALNQSIASLSEDQFASHVLQTLLLSLSCRVQSGSSAVETQLQTWVLSTADDLVARLQPLAHHQYGSHVLRTCLECLSGCQVPQLSRSRRSHEQRWRSQPAQPMKLEKHKNPPVFTEKFIEISKAVKNYDGLNGSLADENFSTLVQLVLFILHALPMPKMSRKFIKRLMKIHFGGSAIAEASALPSVFEDESSLRVLEVALGSSEDEIFGRLYSKYYGGRLCTLMQDAVLRISVQRLVEACPDADVLESVLDELDTDSAATWWTSTRLPTALASACVRLCSHQAHLMKLAARVCDCELPERGPLLAACILYRTTWQHFQSMQTRLASVQITMDGSLLLQAMLKFSKPTRLISGLLSLRPVQLAAVIQSTTGCHVIDALVASPHMGDKAKSRLLESLKEELVTLACSKSGSRALDTLWSSGSPAHRAFIAETLAPHQAQLGDNFFGKFAVRNFALQLFVKKRADWLTYVKREVNKRKMFADLLPTSTAGVPAKRTKQQSQKPPEKPEQRWKRHVEASPRRARQPRIDTSEHGGLLVIDRAGVQGVLDDLE